MEFLEQLSALQAAEGEPAKLALAAVDLAYPALPDGERSALREALAAAAIPHWCDAAILAALLGITAEESHCSTRGSAAWQSWSGFRHGARRR